MKNAEVGSAGFPDGSDDLASTLGKHQLTHGADAEIVRYSGVVSDPSAIDALLEHFKLEFEFKEAMNDTAVPRAQRRRCRPPEKRGLPEKASQLLLARTWLENQRRLWPEMVASGELPDLTDQVLDDLAKDFERRFLNKELAEYQPTGNLPSSVEIGGAYVRYSSDHSNPASLDQQLLKQLNRAREQKVFIPWNFVFADAAVTGTITARHG